MKLTKNRKSIPVALIATWLLLTLNTALNAQKANEELKDFKITIERSDNEIIMKCSEGCAWLDLTYENKDEFQAINEFGMTEIKEDQSDNNENLPKLLITVAKTDNGISLKGLKGTAWTDLSFSLRNSQRRMIDQFGMTN
ncbi:MAG: hypothetical protein R2828_32510 [Saprospiraceae bacterium]